MRPKLLVLCFAYSKDFSTHALCYKQIACDIVRLSAVHCSVRDAVLQVQSTHFMTSTIQLIVHPLLFALSVKSSHTAAIVLN